MPDYPETGTPAGSPDASAASTHGSINNVSQGGVSAEHPDTALAPFLVGPATENQWNAVHLQLVPIACWGVDDVRFAFDSSFLDSDASSDAASDPNDIRAELAHLLELIKGHPGCPLSIFGHADPVGTDDYNKALSGRRAMAVYALLTINSDSGTAVSITQEISSTEKWGDKQRGAMQALTGLPAGTADSTLIQAYLKKLCPTELVLAKTDFLAQGADKDHKGDVQGCSEFNPLKIFSQEKQTKFETAKQQNDTAGIQDRNIQNAVNRRTIVLMFRKGSKVDPVKWPCPSTKNGIADCQKQFWSDGEKRRSTHLSGIDRTYDATKDTFACRFFDRLTRTSPCQPAAGFLRIRLHDYWGRKMPGVSYSAQNGAKQSVGKTTSEGFVNIPIDPAVERVQIYWDPSKGPPQSATDYNYQLDLFVDVADFDSTDGINRRLHNLGYSIDIQDQATKLRAFQGQHDLDISGTLDEATKTRLLQIYDIALDQHIDVSPEDANVGPRDERT